MKNLIKLSALAALSAGIVSAAEYKIDAFHSNVGFVAKHLTISKVNGNFKSYDAVVDYDKATNELKTLTADIDVTSINTQNEKRDKHLVGDDFFDAAKFPKINKWIKVSALEKLGINNLEDEIYHYIMNGDVEDSSQKLVITNVRHKSALEKTNEALLNILSTISMGLPMDLMAVDIKDALDSLSEVTGEISSEDLLDHIFSNFCVGK